MAQQQSKDANALGDEALAYAVRGWPVFPCTRDKNPLVKSQDDTPGGFHLATCEVATITAWWKRWPRASIGMPTGAVSGCFVVDVDPRHGGDATWSALERQHGDIPHTPHALTGGGGSHFFFQHPGWPVKIGANVLGDGIDIRGDGGYVILPPSPHPSGTPYAWDVTADMEDTPLAPAPAWILDVLRRAREPGKARFQLPDHIPEGQRDATLFTLASAIRRVGMGEEEILAVLETANTRCTPPLPHAHLIRLARQGAKYIPAIGNGQSPASPTRLPDMVREVGQVLLPDIPFGDVFNAEVFVQLYGKDVLYCDEWKAWLLWTGTHWEKDRTEAINGFAVSCIKWLIVHAASITHDPLSKHAFKCLNNARILSMLEQVGPLVAKTPEDFDRHPSLFNCRNGTIDLLTGTLLSHDRAHCLTRCAPVDYHPQATNARWETFLWQLMGGEAHEEATASMAQLEAWATHDADVTALCTFLQRAIGYSLLGMVHEKVLLLPYGTGDNGKTTFLEIVSEVFGPGYAMRLPTTLFLLKREGAVPNDVAMLRGVRFAYASEPDQHRRLDESLLKELTGGDRVSARFMRGEFFSFLPEFTLWMSVNHKPKTTGTDNALWNRLKLVPFTVTIPKARQDRTLKSAILADKEGILAWMVRGCLDWQAYGLAEPVVVQQATMDYRKENDALQQFLTGCCVLADYAKTKSSVLYHTYRTWCENDGEKSYLTQTAFSLALKEKGYEAEKTRNGMFFNGIGIQASEETC